MTGDVALPADNDVKLPLASQLLDKLTSCLPGDRCKLPPSPLVYRNGQAQSFLTVIGWLPQCCLCRMQGSHHARGVYRLASAAATLTAELEAACAFMHNGAEPSKFLLYAMYL